MGRKVLVVDDEARMRKLIKDFLTKVCEKNISLDNPKQWSSKFSNPLE